MAVDNVDLQINEWVAIASESTWSIGQFVEQDRESEHIVIDFLKKIPDGYVWPEMVGGVSDRGMVEEADILYRFTPPEGNKFKEMEIREAGDIWREWKANKLIEQ